MKLIDIYNLAIKKGIAKDPRSSREIKEALGKEKSIYRKLKGADKKAFDTERLRNPYADTRILYGAPGKDIKKIIVGIDMESPEIVAVDRLNERARV